MILREIAQPNRFRVYAVCLLPGGECQAERFLLQHAHEFPRAVERIAVAMKEITPQFGPPFEDGNNDLEGAVRIAKRLRNGACEYKAQERRTGQPRGPKYAPRVMFFQDEKWVICTHGFLKHIPPIEAQQDRQILECLRIRALYLEAKSQGIAPVIQKGWAL